MDLSIKSGKQFSATAIKNFDFYFLNSLSATLYSLILTISSYSEESQFLKENQSDILTDCTVSLIGLVNTFGQSLEPFSTQSDSKTEVEFKCQN